MTSILLECKDQLLINPSFTFFPLLEGNLPQLRYLSSCLPFNVQTQTKRSVNQAEQAAHRVKIWLLKIRRSPKTFDPISKTQKRFWQVSKSCFLGDFASGSLELHTGKEWMGQLLQTKFRTNTRSMIYSDKVCFFRSGKQNGGVWRGKRCNVLPTVSQNNIHP